MSEELIRRERARNILATWWEGCSCSSPGAPWECEPCTRAAFVAVRRQLGWSNEPVAYTLLDIRQLMPQYAAQVSFVPIACDHGLCARGRHPGYRYCGEHRSTKHDLLCRDDF